MNLTVIDHHLNEEEGVYRVLIGTPIEHVVPLTDERGNMLRGDDDEPMTETVVEHVPLEDFVFAADDDRWEGMSKDDIAKHQRKLVKERLEEREREAVELEQRQAAAVSSMPGSGEAL